MGGWISAILEGSERVLLPGLKMVVVISIGWEPGAGHWGFGVREKPVIKPVMGCVLASLRMAPVWVYPE